MLKTEGQISLSRQSKRVRPAAICGHPVSGSLVGVFWFEEHNEFLRSILVTPYLANLRRNSRYVYTKNYLTKALLRHRHRTIVVVVNKQPT